MTSAKISRMGRISVERPAAWTRRALLPAEALMFAPRDSRVSAISSALREVVPLLRVVAKSWLRPLFSRVSEGSPARAAAWRRDRSRRGCGSRVRGWR